MKTGVKECLSKVGAQLAKVDKEKVVDLSLKVMSVVGMLGGAWLSDRKLKKQVDECVTKRLDEGK